MKKPKYNKFEKKFLRKFDNMTALVKKKINKSLDKKE